jgi:hypothetical protein
MLGYHENDEHQDYEDVDAHSYQYDSWGWEPDRSDCILGVNTLVIISQVGVRIIFIRAIGYC